MKIVHLKCGIGDAARLKPKPKSGDPDQAILGRCPCPEKIMASANLYLQSSKQNGHSSVAIRIIHNRKARAIRIGVSVKPEHWSGELSKTA